jgi:hypothetical protein
MSTPGTGATVTSLASGDPNCPNGGASGLSGPHIRTLASLGAFVALGKALF